MTEARNHGGEEHTRVSARRLLALAVPALGVLVAEPLYLLLDSVVVGRLGAVPLAGLAVGSVVLIQVSTQLTFLSYGTTSRAARLHGAGRDRDAVGEGVQATWIALVLGAVIVLVVHMSIDPIVSVLGADSAIAGGAGNWLSVAVIGVPMILVSLAGNGWMRGVQDTGRPLRYVVGGVAVSAVLCPILVHGLLGAPRLGLVGSAVANVAGQSVAAAAFLGALARAAVPLAPRWSIIKEHLVLARDLVLRSLGFQVCFLSATAVAARFGAPSVAAHQLVLQLWFLSALVLDSLAIAAQSLVGAALGVDRGDSGAAVRAMARRITLWSTVLAIVLAAAFAAGWGVIAPLLTSDPIVIERMNDIWWLFVLVLPIAGAVFGLDGILLGAGDAAFLRSSTLAAALGGFLPLIWLSLKFDWGLRGIWVGLVLFLVLRLAAVWWRTASGAWITTGAHISRTVRKGY